MAFGRDPPVIFRVGGWLWPRPACFFWAGGGPGFFFLSLSGAARPVPPPQISLRSRSYFGILLLCSWSPVLAPGPVGIFSLLPSDASVWGTGGLRLSVFLCQTCRVTANDPDLRKAGGHVVRCGAQLGHSGGGLGSVNWESVRLAARSWASRPSRRPVGQFPSI